MTRENTIKSDVLVIGAGIAGLAAAYYTKKKGKSVHVLESSTRAGGVIRTEKTKGFLLEHGPNTVLATAELNNLIEDLNLKDRMLIADSKTPRYIQFNGKLHAVPFSPPALLSTKLLSMKGKARLLMEPFIGSPKHGSLDESLNVFAERRLGVQAAERLLAPFVSGVWAGDVNRLSASAAFPKFSHMEKKYGSLFLGMLKNREKGFPSEKKIKGLISFHEGLGTLPQALANELKASLHTNTTAQKIRRSTAQSGTPWAVDTNQGVFEASQLIIAAPAYVAGPLISPLATEPAACLSRIPYAPLAVLHLSLKNERIGNPPHGFGYLTTPKENKKVLGCLWSSSLFPGRAPKGVALLTVFMGGAMHPEIVAQKDADLVNWAVAELTPLLELKEKPAALSITRYEKAIPQYNIGHANIIKALERAERDFPGLKFIANYRGGISVGDVVRNAHAFVLTQS